MNTLSTLFLYSARLYSSLADAIFADSVEQIQFAASTSSRRMETSKSIIGTPKDIEVNLTDEDTEILHETPSWQSCIALDNVLMRIMASDEKQFLPLLVGVYTVARQGVALMKSKIQTEQKMCLACGAISEQWTCPICGNEANWLTGVEFPEISEEPEAVDATEDVSLPNLSFGDFAPEVPSLPKRWEVFFEGQGEDDIFQATGLSRPSLR